MKTGRRKGREDALKILYQLDLNNSLSPEHGLEYYDRFFRLEDGNVSEFTRRLVLGVSQQLRNLDQVLSTHSDNWKLERMPAVDRNVLRIGVYELQHCHDIPAQVTLNECVELAKEFGSENTAGFVNGVLDQVHAHVNISGKAT